MKKNDRGSVLLEFIIVMPVLLLLIFGTVQFALILMAKQLTQYAAFNAARAAIVYNPKDYRVPNSSGGGGFFESSGPVHEAAVTSLAFFGFSGGKEANKVEVPGWGKIPGSANIRNQVSIGSDSMDLMEAQQIPAVKVTVIFRFPMLIPYAAEVIGYFHAGGNANDAWDLTGFSPAIEKNDNNDVTFSERMKSIKSGNTLCFTLSETCILPRPWNTTTFPQMPYQDRN